MHRSGTSALTRTLNLVGCDLPKTVLPGDVGNVVGHWEPERICFLNNALFEAAGTIWHDFEAVDEEWLRSPKAAEFRAKAIDIVKEEFGSSALYVLKDPRICRFPAWWIDAIEATGASTSIISIVRNPSEVAASLEKRDGFDASFGVLLWLRNVLDAEAQSRGRPRAYIHYDALLADPKAALHRVSATLGIAWPDNSESSWAEVGRFLSGEHRHHRHEDASAAGGANPLAREAYTILLRWAQVGESSADYPALDRLLARLNEESRIFGRLVSMQVRDQRNARRLETKLADAEKHAARLGGMVDDAAKQIDQHANGIGRLSVRLAIVEGALKRRGADQAGLAPEVSAVEALISELSALQPVEENESGPPSPNDALTERLAKVEAERRRLSAQIDVLTSRLVETATMQRSALQAAKNDADRLREEVHKSQTELAAHRTEISILSQRLRLNEEESQTLRKLNSSCRAELAVSRSDNAALSQRLKLLQEKSEAMRQDVQRCESAALEARRAAAASAETALRAIAAAPFLPALRGEQLRRRAAMLRATGLFDPDWYSARYPDIAASGMDPAVHFLRFGLQEGRHPNRKAAIESGEQ
jgi:hypothetical protein